MPNKMLIDAAHPEETRVVVVRGSRVEDFDFESANRKQLRGNIYLAKVTRIEPSLQAAFVEYGGNRHGFLAFSEIHPDYYQIPVADRQALLEAEEAEARARDSAADAADEDAEASDEDGADEVTEAAEESDSDSDDAEGNEAGSGRRRESVESVGAGDALEEVPERKRARPRQYKIQEVIRRRQVILVQVVKEERGNKGAALTTYLSLAGRYSVLMPNTARGGGISRKITNPADRKRLKEVASDLEVPEGMGVILRTAGASRTKSEVKRDFEYLLRLWESVRELTLRSTAPTLVYEEGSLIKRSIRDLYGRDISEILVAGDEGYREAKDFMRMLMPSHAKNVQPFRDSQPLFTKFGVEAQLDAMFSPQVQLPAGGYIVINQTEALVSIDVNSGRSTREHSIEDTALQTNLQAAEEVARQLRLRDLAGLIVIDFIDMEERRNNRSVERKMKDCLKDDRARIQVGRISHFGLLEMSRQRIRTGVLESTTDVCPHCMGTGHVRSAASVALHVLRSLEDHLLKGVTHNLDVRTKTNVALYILNQKRATISELEQRFGLFINVVADESVTSAMHFVIEKGDPVSPRAIESAPSIQPTSVQPEYDDDDDDADTDSGDRSEDIESHADGEGQGRRKRRRRRRRSDNGEARIAEPAEADAEADADAGASEAGEPDDENIETAETSGEDDDSQPKRRRRGRRGGRRSKRGGAKQQQTEEAAAESAESGDSEGDTLTRAYEIAEELSAVVPASEDEQTAAEIDTTPTADAPEDSQAPARSTRSRRRRAEAPAEAMPEREPEPESFAESEDAEPETHANGGDESASRADGDQEAEQEQPADQKRRGGWWQRRGFF